MEARKKILIVDDESITRVFLRKVLAEDGYEVLCAGDGKVAIKYLEKQRFDLILLDLVMPRTNGIETMRRIRKLDRDIPVILLSGYLNKENIEKAAEFAVFDHIAKPFKLDDLKRKVRKALTAKKATPPEYTYY